MASPVTHASPHDDASAQADRWDRGAILELGGSVLAAAAVLSVFARFVTWIEMRPGVVLPDPVLAHLQPRDLSWLTFALVYGSMAIAILSLWRHPRALALAVRSYAVMVLLRIVAMALLPLDPPPGMIPLHDPLVQVLGTGGQLLTRDLFFSGHTATLVLVALNVRGRLRVVFLAGTVLVAACVVWQAVHYTIDVLAAPVFAYAAYRIAVVATPLGSRGGSDRSMVTPVGPEGPSRPRPADA